MRPPQVLRRAPLTAVQRNARAMLRTTTLAWGLAQTRPVAATQLRGAFFFSASPRPAA